MFTICSIAGLAVNIVVDVLLIPKFDFIGACIGTLVSEVSIFGIGVYFIKAMDRNISFIRASWKPLVSGVLMAIVLYQFRRSSLTGAICGVLLSSLVYALTVVILRTFSSGEIFSLKESLLFLKKKSCTLPPVQSGEVQ